ncbi:hypothetical protein [Aurantiacibacter spongiae]|uniref:Sulfotransferase family protein n=1 Tax=Aurantiacibacter spongiae TaxID=2488860 RepID=A0A3N5DJW0_9SPHN|nr:hypothetical protein [Aurantiacibacter spongiae]RPF71025.1 hypothetical protein EG799_04915 [Aurantiacibacter spongiae]
MRKRRTERAETIRRVQVYGQRCSGTNALISLIEANFPSLQFTEEFGFKHWFVPDCTDIPADVMVIAVAREASDWLQSLFRNPWHAHPDLKAMSFADFIRAEWNSVWDTHFWGIDADHPLHGRPIAEELCPKTGERFGNVLLKRRAKLENWRSAAQRAGASFLVSHSRVVGDQKGLVADIARAAGISPPAQFTPVASYKGQNNRPFIPSRYPELEPEDRDFVLNHVDPELERAFGLFPAVA